ncbi:MAG: hypothetical protein RMJ57_08880 [Bacteroidia bacterium]|nr:hypothetical protein [Bacteroidia bacterium]
MGGCATQVKARLDSMLPDRIPQAFLWKGPEGVGKTAAAWMVSKALLCPHAEGGEPCHACSTCQRVDRLEHPNLLILPPVGGKVPLEEGVQRLRAALVENPFLSLSEWEMLLPDAKGNLSIGVDMARRLQESLSLTNPDGSWRIVWFWHAETLTRQAANALLKLVEEPSERVLFIFLTHQAEMLPITLRSRCQVWYFPPLSKEKLEGLIGSKLSASQWSLSEGSYSRLRRLREASMEKYIQALQSWLRSLLEEGGDSAPAIEELLRAPQLSEILVMGAILIREHPRLTPAQKAVGMDTLLRVAEEIEANIQPALLLWEATLFLRAQWARPSFLWEWLLV